MMADRLESETDDRAFIAGIPKAELHVHLEGCLHPELIQRLAKRNEVEISEEDVKFPTGQDLDLETFLRVYSNGIKVLLTEQDFYDVVRDYAGTAAKQNVKHVEMFFDPQLHFARGVELKTIIAGVRRAAAYAHAELDMSLTLIMCFLREESVDSAMEVLLDAVHYKDIIKGVGLDGDPTHGMLQDFNGVFRKAREMGFFKTAHCDVMDSVDESVEVIRQALELLEVDRLDHASYLLEDEGSTALVKEKRIGITCCPRTGLLLYRDTEASMIRRMLAKGLNCSVHSDDPGYFDAHVNENLESLVDEGLHREDIVQLATNSIEASWADAERKRTLLNALEEYVMQKAR